MSEAFKNFTSLALRTESRPQSLAINPGLLAQALHAAVLLTEALDQIKKTAFYGKELNVDELRDNLNQAASIMNFVSNEAEMLADPNADVVRIRRTEEGKESDDSYIELNPNSFPVRMTHAVIGTLTESGELVRALLDSVLGNTPIDKVNVGEEFADIDWYKAIAFDELGLSEGDTREAVIAKLKKRYPEKFDAAAALNRNLEAEREALDNHIA